MTIISFHNITKTEIDAKEVDGVQWVTYIFTDKDGKKFEVTAFKQK